MTTTNLLPDEDVGDWAADIATRVVLDATEKEALVAIATLGTYTPPRSASTSSPMNMLPMPRDEALETLEKHGLVTHELHGETRTRGGRRRHDGTDIHRMTKLGRQWLKNCRREDPAEAAGAELREAI